MTKILVTGSSGQLGRELMDLKDSLHDAEFNFLGSSDLDIADPQKVRETVASYEPNFVVNAAAYTKVDRAEEENRSAFKTNATALRYLCLACNSVGAALIHISSDYVYDSVRDRPISEEDELCPQSVYARTKAKGEQYVRELANNWLIIRTSWVYSEYGNNFVKTMLRLGQSRKELSVVNDQIGTPTYAKDLARVIVNFIDLIRSKKRNNDVINQFYNFSNEGLTSWDAFARKIFDLSKIECEVKGISTKAYGAKAARPLWSVLSKEKIKSKLGIEIRDWEAALSECLVQLQK